jgi:hypothetical protein
MGLNPTAQGRCGSRRTPPWAVKLRPVGLDVPILLRHLLRLAGGRLELRRAGIVVRTVYVPTAFPRFRARLVPAFPERRLATKFGGNAGQADAIRA